LIVVGLGFAGSQAGHLLAYQLRFGAAAEQIQSGGAHAYFPALAKTGLGVASLGLIAALFIVGAARVIAGRRIVAGSAPSWMRLLAVVYTVQLACFALQETVEALVGGVHASSAPMLLLWGAAGQLPVAVVVSLAARWFLARLEPALAQLRLQPTPSHQYLAYALAPAAWPPAAGAVVPSYVLAAGFNRRGPPSF